MARNKLSETRIRTIKRAGVYSDGDGLFLRVRTGGSKQWFFIYRRGDKRTEIGLGGYGQGTAPVDLALAREKADALRKRLARGDDVAKRRTFSEVMDDVIAVKSASFRNEKHKAQWRMTLDRYAVALHKKPVADVTRDDVVETLKPIWTTIPETADRLRMRIAAVIDHAKARGLFIGDNPADWRGGLKELLPARQKLTRGHHAALAYADAPTLCAGLRASKGVAARAVEFTTLTAARTGEVRGATFGEIDFDAGLWVVPAERMKAGREHRVPLVPRAVAIIREMKERATGELAFGGGRDGAAVSDTAMTKALRLASPDKAATLHGLRSMFRDWCGDHTEFPREIAEAALAHQVGNAVELAYRRSDALEKRRALMTAWSAHCGNS